MKILLNIALLVSVVMASTTAFAGRDDLQLNMQAQSIKALAAKKSDSSASAVGKAQPLDHGPRATTTQWQNKQNQNSAAAAESK
jgi:uncharacterized membrane protein